MDFKTSELKEFIAKSKAIRVNNILPILSYIKYDSGVLTKTNQETFFSSKISTNDKGCFLIDERIISAYLKDFPSDTINIEQDGNFMVINKKTRFPAEKAEMFPKAPESDTINKVALDETIMKAISYFGSLTMSSEITHNLCFVHIAGGGMFASNNHCFVSKEIDLKNDGIILSREACALLSSYSEVEYYSNENYNFFISGGNSIAIIKPHASTPLEQFKKVIESGNKDDYFEVDKGLLLSFCEFATAVSGSLLPECAASVKKGVMSLSLNDSAYEITDKRDIDVDGDFEIESFSFNPKILSPFLRALPYGVIRFSPHEQKGVLSVWTIEDNKFNGVLIGLN
jgi:hypothetical protein